MKARHLLSLAAVAIILGFALVSCSDLGVVSITDRLTTFQTDLNAADRTSIYLNFHPTSTMDYDALKDPTTTIDPLFPVLGTTDTVYTLTIDDQANPATGVLVTVTGGPAGFGAPKYLKLVMDTTGVADYRIVSLSMSTVTSTYPTPQIQ
jgi:hypothetical protein